MPTHSAPPSVRAGRLLLRSRVVRFLISGGAIAVLALSLTACLLATGLPFQVAFAIAYATSVAVQFLLHRHFTFAGDGGFRLSARHQAARFFALTAVHYVAIAVSTELVSRALDLPPLLVYAAVALLAAVVNFVVLLLRVFHRGHDHQLGGDEQRAADGQRAASADEALLDRRDALERSVEPSQ